MAKILLSEEVKRVQTEIRRLSTLLRRINEFKTTLKVEGTDKEQNIAKFLQDNIDLLGSYSVDDVANNLDTNKSVIANLSIVAENVQSLINREKNYASIDLTNVVVDIANLGKILSVGAGGVISYKRENIKNLTYLTTQDELYKAVEIGDWAIIKVNNRSVFINVDDKTAVRVLFTGASGSSTVWSFVDGNFTSGSQNPPLTTAARVNGSAGTSTSHFVTKAQLDAVGGNTHTGSGS